VHNKGVSGPNQFGPAITDLCIRDTPQLLVTASRGLSTVKRFTAGSVSDHCVHQAPCPVLVYKRDKNSTVNPALEDDSGTILLAVDGSDRSLSVYNFTINNVFKPKQHLTIVHVFSTSHTDAQWNGVKLLEDYSTRAKSDGLESRVTTHLGKSMMAGKYITKLCDATSMTPAEREAVTGVAGKNAPYMLVVASRGLNKVKRALMGSVSDHCVHNAECPVLVFKTPPSLSLRVASGVGESHDLRPVSATVSVPPTGHKPSPKNKSPRTSFGKDDDPHAPAKLGHASINAAGISDALEGVTLSSDKDGKKRSVSMTSRSAGSEESAPSDRASDDNAIHSDRSSASSASHSGGSQSAESLGSSPEE